MQTPSPPPPEFWEQFWHILQFTQFVLFAAFAWVWRKINNVEEGSSRKIGAVQEQLAKQRDACTELDKKIIESKTEIHRDFVTKKDLHEIIEVSVRPIRESLNRVDRKLDRLIDRHIGKNGYEED